MASHQCSGVTVMVAVPPGTFGWRSNGSCRLRWTDREICYDDRGRAGVWYYGRWVEIRPPDVQNAKKCRARRRVRWYVAVKDGTPRDAEIGLYEVRGG